MFDRIVSRVCTFVACAAVALGCLAACGCSSYPTVDEALAGKVRTPTVGTTATMEPGVLTVGVNAGNAPYAWVLGSRLNGIDADVALAMAEQMGLTVKFVDVGANLDAAAQGMCDVVMGATASGVTPSEVVVGTYVETAPALFAVNANGVVSVETLAVTNVGVQADSISARVLTTMAPTVTLTSFDTLNDAFAALAAQQVPYVACDSFMGGYLAKDYPGVGLAGSLALPEMRGVAVASVNIELQTAIQRGIDAITADGELRLIRSNWVGNLATVSAANQVAAQAAY